MATSSCLATGLKALFFVLGCVMAGTLVYTIYIDGLPFRKDLLTPWMVATLVDYYINVVPLATWVCYKESSRIGAIIWIILFICLGSVATCAYIFIQFINLSPHECLHDPMYHVLLRHSNKDNNSHERKCSDVTLARIVFGTLGCLMLATLLYTLITDGSPFRLDVLTPWVIATLVDFYINVTALSVWVAYRGSNWFQAFIWVILLICFGSITTCVYIVNQLLQLSSQDPLYLVLLNGNDRSYSYLWMVGQKADMREQCNEPNPMEAVLTGSD
ncbi:hypothetical protein ACFE04_004331 [Oxalis oulophora]